MFGAGSTNSLEGTDIARIRWVEPSRGTVVMDDPASATQDLITPTARHAVGVFCCRCPEADALP